VTDLYERRREEFSWSIPELFNIGTACVDAHDPRQPALLLAGADGSVQTVTFGDVALYADRLANALRGLGVGPGDRVAVVLAQRLETAVSHVAVYRLGAVAVPMSVMFGYEALEHRFRDSGAQVIVTDAERLERVEAAAAGTGAVIVVVDGEPPSPHVGLASLVASASGKFSPVATTAETPALLIYTSGTTGPPKAALHAHRVLLGHQPGFQLSHDDFPQPGDRFWTVADWAWVGGLFNGLLSSWCHGRPVVAASRAGFDPEWAVRVITSFGVRNTFVPPTALKLMRKADVRVPAGTLRTVMSGGESLGADVLEWGRGALGVTVNEIYGQTEANYVIGNSQAVWTVRPGSMGRAYPGHTVAVIGADGGLAAAGELGEIAVALPDPVSFLGYWRDPEATAAKTSGGWLRTGDRGRLDEDGYFWFEGRTDDVISSAGYRIGPDEIEQCLHRHPSVALAAVIGVPDDTRGEVVKAFLRLTDGAVPSAALEADIRAHVRTQLAPYEVPRVIEFVDEIPLTVTGKVQRSELRRRERERGLPGETVP
jgi:acetyl-CoA synthetase